MIPDPALVVSVTSDTAVSSIPPGSENAESFQETPAQTQVIEPTMLWPSFLESLMDERPNLATFLSVAYVASVTDNSVDIRFSGRYGFQFAEITRKSNRDIIEKMLATFTGKKMDLHITREREKKEETEQAESPTPQKSSYTPSLRDDMENEPIIKTVIDVFDGEILP